MSVTLTKTGDRPASILRTLRGTTPKFTRYTPTNGRKPEGTYYGVDGYTFTFPAESIGEAHHVERTYAVYQISRGGGLFWECREVDGKRRSVGRWTDKRKEAVDTARRAVATAREEEAAEVADKRTAAGLDPAGKPYRVAIVDGGGAVLHVRCGCPAIGASRWDNREAAAEHAEEVTAHSDAGWKLCDAARFTVQRTGGTVEVVDTLTGRVSGVVVLSVPNGWSIAARLEDTYTHEAVRPVAQAEACAEAVAAELEARQALRDMWRHGSPRCALTRYAETAGTLADRDATS